MKTHIDTAFLQGHILHWSFELPSIVHVPLPTQPSSVHKNVSIPSSLYPRSQLTVISLPKVVPDVTFTSPFSMFKFPQSVNKYGASTFVF